jgi:hypothetical protein
MCQFGTASSLPMKFRLTISANRHLAKKMSIRAIYFFRLLLVVLQANYLQTKLVEDFGIHWMELNDALNAVLLYLDSTSLKSRVSRD